MVSIANTLISRAGDSSTSSSNSSSNTQSSSSTSSSTDTSSITGASNTLVKNFDTFLTLLTTQLKYQDPVNPMDTKDLTTQLVQFSSVEQQINTNKNLQALIASATANEQSQAVSYIGWDIETAGTNNYFNGTSGDAVQWTYSLPSDVQKNVIQIVDSKAQVVWQGQGDLTSGSHNFVWDGKDMNGDTLPAGNYTLKISAADANSKAVTAGVNLLGQVTGVETKDGEVYLLVGSAQYKMSDVLAVHQPSVLNTASNSSTN